MRGAAQRDGVLRSRGLTDDVRQALLHAGIERVTIAFDRDAAGVEGAKKVGAELLKLGKAVSVARFPHGHDANSYALTLPAAERGRALQQLVQGAEWLGNGKGPSQPKAGREDLRGAAPEALPPSGGNDMAPSLAAASPEAATREQLKEEAVELAAHGDRRSAQGSSSVNTSDEGDSHSGGAASADEVTYQHGDRRWRVRGLARNEKPGVLRVNLFVSRSVSAHDGGGFHVDTIELYNARHRQSFIKQAAEEMGCEERVVKRDIGRVLLALEQRQERQLAADRAPKARTPELSNAEKVEAMELLKDPRLIDRILEDMDACGVVGERNNKLIGYLAATSRKTSRPLAVVIQSSSAAGKSSLMDAVLSLMPEEEQVQYSAMTGQSLFYMAEQDLKYRISRLLKRKAPSVLRTR